MKFKILAQEKTINQIKKQKQKTYFFSAFIWIATVCTPHPHQPRLLPLTIIVGLFALGQAYLGRKTRLLL